MTVDLGIHLRPNPEGTVTGTIYMFVLGDDGGVIEVRKKIVEGFKAKHVDEYTADCWTWPLVTDPVELAEAHRQRNQAE